MVTIAGMGVGGRKPLEEDKEEEWELDKFLGVHWEVAKGYLVCDEILFVD